VLYEGYLLYPYRASAEKNQARWQFGVLTPPSYAAAGHGEHDAARTEVLIEPGTDPLVHCRVRFLQVQHRALWNSAGAEVDMLGSLVPWDETVERETDVVLRLSELLEAPHTTPITYAAGSESEAVQGGEIVRTRWPIEGELRCSLDRLPGPYGVLRLRADLVNVSESDCSGELRPVALRRSMIAAHTLFALTDASFISMLDPPEWAKGYVADCRNEHTWPVMLGAEGEQDTLLSSPIILYDHPEIAPESPGDFFDATEMDEMLTLRTLTMTEEEKSEARATDERSRELIDRVEGLPPELIDRLHGAVRSLRPVIHDVPAEPLPAEEITAPPGVPWWDPGADASVSPETDRVMIDGVAIGKGSAVILRPGARRSDAQDMFLAERRATVQAVLLDVDGETHVAVTLDEDPGADLQIAQGRFTYFAPHEVAPVIEEQST
ncbi:MAG: hypothetical protein ACRDRL_19505, partial [Sciscionella sp.]